MTQPTALEWSDEEVYEDDDAEHGLQELALEEALA